MIPASGYDPFARGGLPVGVRTIEAHDAGRGRTFPCETWYPAAGAEGRGDSRDAPARPGAYPLILFSHASAANRRSATYLCAHLASRGYVVAAMDHSELVAPELSRKDAESAGQRAKRVQAIIASRVPDMRFLLDHLLEVPALGPDAMIDPSRIGIAGHSFGGWTALAAAQVEPRIRAVVALAPGGSSNPKPGILPLKLEFDASRGIATLFLVAEDDTSLPLDGMREILAKTPGAKRMIILRRADHCHFMDDVEERHEALRKGSWSADLAWLNAMRPIAELCSGEQAHSFTRGLALCHMDAVLRDHEGAWQLLSGDLQGELAARGIDAIVDDEV